MAAVKILWLSVLLQTQKNRESPIFNLFVSLAISSLPIVDTLPGTTGIQTVLFKLTAYHFIEITVFETFRYYNYHGTIVF